MLSGESVHEGRQFLGKLVTPLVVWLQMVGGANSMPLWDLG